MHPTVQICRPSVSSTRAGRLTIKADGIFGFSNSCGSIAGGEVCAAWQGLSDMGFGDVMKVSQSPTNPSGIWSPARGKSDGWLWGIWGRPHRPVVSAGGRPEQDDERWWTASPNPAF